MIALFLIFWVLWNMSLLQVHAAQSFWPAAVPLAVRSPYLNSWADTQNGSDTSNSWPAFWDGNVSLARIEFRLTCHALSIP